MATTKARTRLPDGSARKYLHNEGEAMQQLVRTLLVMLQAHNGLTEQAESISGTREHSDPLLQPMVLLNNKILA
jgi:hypothetical protein